MSIPAASHAGLMRRLKARPTPHWAPGSVLIRPRSTTPLSARDSTSMISRGSRILSAKAGSARISSTTWAITSKALSMSDS